MYKAVELLFAMQPRSESEKVFIKLKQMLLNYEIVPGQKLQLQDFADRFHLSRTPIQNAFTMMEREGLLELRPNKGYYVLEIGPKELNELFDIRLGLENVSIQGAVRNQNKESMHKLREALRRYQNNTNKEVSRLRMILDAEFHLAIAEMSENAHLVGLLRMILTKIYLRHKVENVTQERRKQASQEHKEIYHAIRSKDVGLAVEKMVTHINAGRNNILGFIAAELQ
jgi:DNA-binding GntR family transcriptional regulator